VVLCAGAVHSPAILLRSGVGPAAQLRDLAIPLVQAAPVGLRDQPRPAWPWRRFRHGHADMVRPR